MDCLKLWLGVCLLSGAELFCPAAAPSGCPASKMQQLPTLETIVPSLQHPATPCLLSKQWVADTFPTFTSSDWRAQRVIQLLSEDITGRGPGVELDSSRFGSFFKYYGDRR